MNLSIKSHEIRIDKSQNIQFVELWQTVQMLPNGF